MKFYICGGFVRDSLLNVKPKDRDWVVVGATPEMMTDAGYEQVGASFPVYLKDGEEYALARTERKVAPGYTGFDVKFDPEITLESDLFRRDLTINSMALDPETNELIDPYGGQEDIKRRVLRHTSDSFAEDPIRILRTARFAARYPTFSIDGGTIELMKKVAPELNFVPKERIWAEFRKGLMEEHPFAMYDALKKCDAFSQPALSPYGSTSGTILMGVRTEMSLPVRFASIGYGFTSDKIFNEWTIPSDCAELCKLYQVHSQKLMQYLDLSAEERVTLFNNLKTFNNKKPLYRMLRVLEMSYNIGVLRNFASLMLAIIKDLSRLDMVNVQKIVEQCSSGLMIKQSLFDARVAALKG